MKRRNKYLLVGILLISMGMIMHMLYLYVLDRENIYAEKISDSINRTIKEIRGTHQKIENYIEKNENIRFSDINIYASQPTYIYKKENLVYWSNDHYTPSDTLVKHAGGISLIDQEYQKFIIAVSPVEKGDQEFHIISLIPLYIRFDLSNEYLESGYHPDYFESSELKINKDKKQTPVIGPEGQVLFYAEFLPGYVAGFHWLPFTIFSLITAGTLCMLYWMILFASFYKKNGSLWRSLLLLFAGLLLVRIVMLTAQYPFHYLNFSLFDSKYYASSFFNPSLGDVCINVSFLLIFAWFFFANYAHKDFIRILRINNERSRWIYGFITILLFHFCSFYVYKIIESLSTHSQWSLDISSGIYFSAFRWISYFLFVLSAVTYILFTYILNKIIQRLYKDSIVSLSLVYLVATAVFFLVFFQIPGPGILVIGLLTGVFIFFSFRISIRSVFVRLRYKTFVYILAVFIFAALIGATAINKVRNNQERLRVERFGEQLVQENDPITEYFLVEAANQIQDDVFIKNRLFSPFASKDIIEEKIKRVYLNNYLDKYEINILLFNSRGEPFSSGIELTYHEIRDRLIRPQFKTDYENLFFILIEQPVIQKRYLHFIPVYQYNSIAGYAILDLQLKKVIPTKVYPRLLLDDRFSVTYFEDQYDYALFKNNQLINSSGSFNYDKNFSKRLLETEALYMSNVRFNGYRHTGFHSDGGRIYVISHPIHSWIYYFANFSFLFLLLSLCFLLTLVVYAIYFNLLGVEINYVTRIQLYLNLAFFIPLIVISVSTLTRSTADYKKKVEEEYLNKAEVTSNNITGYLQNFISNNSSIEELSSKLSELADFSELDMDIYRVIQKEGRLLVSTQPLIFDKHILSELVDPRVLASIMEQGEKGMIRDKTFGKMAYKTAYVAIRSTNDGELIGILSIPFFGSQAAIDENLTGLVINILSIFTIIFISFIVLSFFVSTYLTFPLKFLTDRLRKTSLTGRNEPLLYDSADEIGQLVKEYNNMLLKLEESKKALAQSEKEAAWREMAKQVAHEIKNPLTPMKLTLQHMKIRVSGDQEEKTKLEKSINSLLHNIETLSDIATSFSNYAQMPVPEKEPFDIVGLLKRTVNIYMNSEQEADIKVYIPDEPVTVEGDPGWIGRTFSNLIINGIQATEKGRKPAIEITLEKTMTGKIVIKISDNGKGISDEIRDKIFMPNFSTKYSGSGIGLAIAKRAIEHAGGKIWFESVIDKGTSFYIELPAAS